jgi:hypothetical protein
MTEDGLLWRLRAFDFEGFSVLCPLSSVL